MKATHFLLLALIALPIAELSARTPVENILAKAREYLGGEEHLNEIQSIRFEGAFVQENSMGTFTTILRKPMFYRSEFDDGEATAITGYDGVSGWHRVTHNEDPGEDFLRALNPRENRRLRLNIHDNLFMYTELERVRGEIRYVERTFKDGFPAHRLAFYYDGELVFHRYFDAEDGALIATTNPDGITVREYGSRIVNGVRFPRRVVATLQGEEVSILEYDRIVINEEHAEEIFEFPVMPLTRPRLEEVMPAEVEP